MLATGKLDPAFEMLSLVLKSFYSATLMSVPAQVQQDVKGWMALLLGVAEVSMEVPRAGFEQVQEESVEAKCRKWVFQILPGRPPEGSWDIAPIGADDYCNAAIGPAQCYRDAQPKSSCTVMPERLGAMALAAAGAYAVTSGFVVSQPAAQQPSEVRLRGAQAQPNSSAGFSSTMLNLAGAGTVAAGLAVSQRKRTALRAEKFAGGLVGSAGGFGEYQFDPIGLAERYPTLLPWFREAELKHGRVAMLAFLGLIVPDAFRLPIDGASDPSIDVIAAHNKLIGPGLGEGLMWNLMVVVGAIESVRFKQIGLGFENLTLENAGDLGLRALAPGTEEGMKLVRTQELKNGRLAMLAVGGCLTQAVAFDVHHFPFLKCPAQCYRDAQPKSSCTVMPERLGAMALAAAGAYAVTSGFVVSQPAAQQPSEVRLRGAQAQPNSSAGFSSTMLNLAGAGTVAAGLAVSQRKRTALRAEKFAGGLVGSAGGFGEYQFDPIGLAERYPTLLPWFREAELKHGRVAMLAFLGLIVPDAFRLPIDGASDPSIDVIAAHNKLIGPGLGEGLMWNLMVVVGAIESVRFKQIGLGFENLTLENAGDLGLRALAPGTEEGMKLVRTQELKNGRLAMLAVGGCLTQAVAFDVHHFPFLK
ncbi:Fucoxanthin-chlorophyll a-c binding protein, chloroplastic [Symbiodinium microadriaticum]|uniref:Fucoxanthin-chlorophyll a-c binding protein, chloroplastic n=1 Tax=Symbiodinium microadriaticum TaxID=2951 RepID=A0A1Q9DXP4_SYMMI|nr:Fucoxanthin-chlorophyll a-c binding protein, chloroplastic [Symbiodinium microadriaticum]